MVAIRIVYVGCENQADQITKMYHAELLVASVMCDEVKVCFGGLHLLRCTVG